ncbi:hypothetical protein ACQP00_08520 [Dactylosporangium sp. CS-047395]|uniref:hypothetical protein n=1 Tax=Dactylosporangium sp. CS-047395 TaxID=3239936 RepID=UPI003D8E3DCD
MTHPPTTPGPDEPAGHPLRPAAPGGTEDDQAPASGASPFDPQAPYDPHSPFAQPQQFGAQPPADPTAGGAQPPADPTTGGAQSPVYPTSGSPTYPASGASPWNPQSTYGEQSTYGAQSGYGPAQPPGGQPPVPQYPQGSAYDPSQAYVVYQAAPGYQQGIPSGGYGIPAAGQQAGFDPMISPDYGGWWQRSIAIFKGAWKQLAILQFIGFLLTLLVVIPEGIWFLSAFTDVIGSAGTENEPSLTPLLAPFLLLFVGAVVAGMVGSLITVAGNQIAVTVASGQRPRLGPAFSVAMRRFLPLWGWQFLSALITLVGLCLCILPGIYLYAVFIILPAVVTFERGGAAISRCFQLVHKDFGSAIARIATIVGLGVLVGVVTYFIGQIIEVAISGVQQASFDPSSETSDQVVLSSAVIASIVVSRLVTSLLEAAMKLFTDVLTVTAYADMRARNEPLSTAQLAAEIGVEPAQGSEWMAPPTAHA